MLVAVKLYLKRMPRKQLGKVDRPTTVNKENLDKELYEWKQKRLEEGKFPCACGHFESSHVKNLCIGCHGSENDKHPAPAHGEGFAVGSCWHKFEQMDNLTIIEWISKNKGEIK